MGRLSIKNLSMQQVVKQDDPLSHWLFNSIIDEMLIELPQQFGDKVGGHHINVIALFWKIE